MTKHIALAGNPNSGKTTLFNLLTGTNQRVGNWPGVTVERKSGTIKKRKHLLIQDLPGIYSLSPYTPEERVARDYLIADQPAAILNVLDATNLERNLYLTLQLLEMGLPIAIALNMTDALKSQGRSINSDQLSYQLGVPVQPISALKKLGISQLLHEVEKITNQQAEPIYPQYDKQFEAGLAQVIDLLSDSIPNHQKRFYAIKLLEQDQVILDQLQLNAQDMLDLTEIIAILEKIYADDMEAIIVNQRYQFIEKITELVTKDSDKAFNLSDNIDRLVTNRFLALPIFAAVMWLTYFLSIQTVGTMGTDWVNDVLFGELVPGLIQANLDRFEIAGWLQSLVLDGIIAGCGAILGFVPQIFVLFVCLGILEDIGYMSRVAFVMDRIFRRFGLSGKSFIPMLISTGCGVPGVMASRTIENEQDRKITIMTATFMPCSAKLPIISLVAGAFFPDNPWIAPSAYFVGMAAIVLSGMALKKTKQLGGVASPFIMELPSYHLPKLSTVLRYAFDKALSFIKRAGTIIFVTNIIIWFSSSYNWSLQMVETDESILASIGHSFSLLFAPLGFENWRATVAAITGLLAKETVIATFGILYKLGETTEENPELWGLLQQDYTALSAYSFLVFNLLCAPCFAAIGAIHREMGEAKWTWIAIGFQTGLAYASSLVIYQIDLVLIHGQLPTVWTFIAIFLIITAIYSLVKKPTNTLPIVTLKTLEKGEY
ncbi:TPA: ferrous iron transport protein B [Streptococcus suis]|uniref:ferrous iron transport protein B n=1 Tax=Streptococcus suis TaxID=1307 RepID=UPI0001E26B28|nr:ferrous iron transport protein B [Streptococcus suis]AHF59863.1 Ferrous iron transport protein B [Streptococcus suis 05HAS68]MCK3817719.1 ferrous iron transport protein B [Streptococcus suis]MCK3854972.1 ferrous iron transport protein B [Streptococcus suis]MCK3872439.1 ferrous iron transport protein B [Streptococcus suis]MCK3884171.1 ferrous iron transport protein B [Streptococcus suis]